jgi:hypothetical protein
MAKNYGAFTHTCSQIDNVAKNILTQEEHHKTKPFKEEYFEMLAKNNIEFKEEYLLEFLLIFIIGIKYCGALHLWVDFQMHFYKYYAALPLNIRP